MTLVSLLWHIQETDQRENGAYYRCTGEWVVSNLVLAPVFTVQNVHYTLVLSPALSPGVSGEQIIILHDVNLWSLA
jgi:hypothetical protein